MTNQANLSPVAAGGGIGDLFKRSEIWLATFVIAVLLALITPLPPWLVDMGLTISIALAVVILMTAIMMRRPLDFSSFPTVLLVATLLRLALNLATTRLILSEGHAGPEAAGNVVKAFAQFVMAGDFIIGVIVFTILTIINFIVITKGAGRIAEVSARFTLDALPGKQMAIDADLSAGLITEDEARARRREMEDESNFFGSMDGAAKFVRGDAMAGIIITAVNIIGGITIGVLRHDLSGLEAADTYIRLTVGDGLVTQIPALLVSVASGLLVAKAGKHEATDKLLFRQLGGYPVGLGMTAFALAGMGLLPGMPMIPFFALAGILSYAAYAIQQQQKAISQKKEEDAQKKIEAPAPVAEEPISASLAIDMIRLELGYGLIALINSPAGHRLTDQIKGLRRQLASDMGFIMPAVRIQDNLQLAPNAYVLRIKEIEAGRGDLRPGMLLSMDPRGETISLPGEATTEPTFGLPAVWIDQTYREEALFKGYTVVDPPTVVTTHLTEVVKDNMAELLSYAETQKLLDELPKEQQKIISDMIPAQISLGGVQRVLQNLLAERVSIRDLSTILEGIAEGAALTRNINTITELVRSRLARQISESQLNEAGFVPLISLSPEWEQTFAESIVQQGEEKQLVMAPSRLQQFITAVRQIYDRHAMMGESPILLTSPGIRSFVRSLVERFRPQTIVMSQNEIHPKTKIKTLGQI